MLSKSIARATAAALALLAVSCTSRLPWSREEPGNEVNLVFVIENNLLFLPSVTVDGHAGRYFLSTASPRTAVDPNFPLPSARTHLLQISEKESLRFRAESVPLGGVGDVMIGSDVWGKHALSIDYSSGLVTLQKSGIQPHAMSLFRFDAEPMIRVMVDGRPLSAIVDTANPDTLVIPSSNDARGTAHVMIGDYDFGPTDVQYARTNRARVGNRLLSRFLVTIDYGKRVVGLWRDPRIPPPATR